MGVLSSCPFCKQSHATRESFVECAKRHCEVCRRPRLSGDGPICGRYHSEEDLARWRKENRSSDEPSVMAKLPTKDDRPPFMGDCPRCKNKHTVDKRYAAFGHAFIGCRVCSTTWHVGSDCAHTATVTFDGKHLCRNCGEEVPPVFPDFDPKKHVIQTRPTRDESMLDVARVIARRGTCVRRQVGCVLTDEHGRIVATGYNGRARGIAHCTDAPCPGAFYESGKGLDVCEAVHAEQNALMQCREVMGVKTCYVTTSPCMHCMKMLLNTSCQTLVVPRGEPYDQGALDLWRAAGREMRYA